MTPALEPSRRDGSNDGSQILFFCGNWLIISKLSLLPLLIWSTGKAGAAQNRVWWTEIVQSQQLCNIFKVERYLTYTLSTTAMPR